MTSKIGMERRAFFMRLRIELVIGHIYKRERRERRKINNTSFDEDILLRE